MAKKHSSTGTKATKKRSAPAGARGGHSPLEGVRIRMYRQGLGDCFLLSFPRRDGGPFHMLIDCGVILGTADAAENMKAVAQDIAAATDDHLHVVVATHEHWDHLSGFIQARDIFDDIAIDEVWFAWTEDPADELARRLRRGQERTLRALQGA